MFGVVPSEGVSSIILLRLPLSKPTQTVEVIKQLTLRIQKQKGLVSVNIQRVIASIKDTASVLHEEGSARRLLLLITTWSTKEAWEASRAATNKLLVTQGTVVHRSLFGEPTAIRNQLWRDGWLPVLGYVADLAGYCAQWRLGEKAPTPVRELLAELRRTKRINEADRLEKMLTEHNKKDNKTAIPVAAQGAFGAVPARHWRLFLLRGLHEATGPTGADGDSPFLGWVSSMPWLAEIALSCSRVNVETTLTTGLEEEGRQAWQEATIISGDSRSYLEKLWEAPPFREWLDAQRDQPNAAELALATGPLL